MRRKADEAARILKEIEDEKQRKIEEEKIEAIRIANAEAKRLEEEQNYNTAELLKDYKPFRFKFDRHQTANFI